MKSYTAGRPLAGDAEFAGDLSIRVPPGMVRSIGVVMLLVGSLFPSIYGGNLVVVGAVIAALCLIGDYLRAIPHLAPGVGFAVVVVAMLASAALVHAPTFGYGHDKVSRLITLTLLSAGAASLISSSERLLTFAWTWLVVAVLLGATATFGIGSGDRAVGLSENNPIWLGRAIATGILIAVWLIWTHRLRFGVGIIVLAVLVYGLLESGSRGPALSSAVGVVIVAVSLEQRKRFTRLLFVLLVALLGLFALASLQVGASSRLTSFITQAQGEPTASSREMFWSATMHMINGHPLGVGYGAWQSYTGFDAHYPHNLFLEVFAEAGWAYGWVLLIVVLIVVLRLVRRLSGNPSVGLALALLISETLNVSVSGDLNARTWFFLLTLGWTVSCWADRSLPREGSRTAPTSPRQEVQPGGVERVSHPAIGSDAKLPPLSEGRGFRHYAAIG